jgi:hypothetical protein
MSVQVAPPLASSGCNRRLVSGFPLTPTPLASLAPRLRVSPDPHSQLAFRLVPASPRFRNLPVIPAGGSSSRLDSFALPRYRV